MQVGVLGPLEVVAGEAGAVHVGGARLRALLIRLALSPGRTVTVDALSDALWPDDGPADSANALQSLVSRLRQTLPGDVPVRSVPAGYRLEIPEDAVDAARFERLAAEGRRLLRAGDPGRAASRLRAALALWRGEALADVAGSPFATATAARLDELKLMAAEDLAEAELGSGADTARIVAELEELVAGHPLRERLLSLHVRALHAGGRQAEALAAFETARARLADELGTDPGHELRDAHLAVLRGDEVWPDRIRRRGNLRASLTGIVGRAEEQAAITAQLEYGRLVTLVGPGGAGKTRLATAVGAALSEDVPGGVWMTELAPLTDPADVPRAVIDALSLREPSVRTGLETHGDAVSRLVDALGTHASVVILDNCEHVVAAAAELADVLLGRCPRLRILATSREPLGIVGESLFEVRPLHLPEPGATARDALASSAVWLLADRARDVRPDFTVDDGNVGAVVEICRRLDGLPLAIELAAARLRSLPVQELARGLGDRFELLARGSRTAPRRHQTLRDVVAWSWDLLDDEERRFAQRLAVFPAAITPEAAEWVGGSAATGATANMLAALVDKSLLQMVDGVESRYRMLETIREYGRQRLAETGGLDDARAAHVCYALDLADRAAPHLRGPGQLPWLARLRDERENLNTALQVACDSGDARTAVRLAAALGMFWTIQGDHTEASRRLRRALETPGRPAPEPRAVATAFYLLNAMLSGELAGAEDIVDSIQRWAGATRGREADPAGVLIDPLLTLMTDDTGAGLAEVDRLMDVEDAWARAMLQLTKAMIRGSGGDIATMCDDLEVSAAAFRGVGERWGVTTSSTILAMSLTMLGDGRAAGAFEESIRLQRELDPGDDAVEQRAWLAQLHARTGQVDRARAELVELVRPATGAPARYVVLARIILGDLARHDGDLDEARRHYDAGVEAGQRSRDRTFDTVLAASRGHLAAAEGDIVAARQRFGEALTTAVEIRDMPLVAMVGVGVARLQAELGAPDRAAEVLGAAHALRGAGDALNPDVVSLSSQLRDQLGERAYDTAHERGRALGRADALTLIADHTRH